MLFLLYLQYSESGANFRQRAPGCKWFILFRLTALTVDYGLDTSFLQGLPDLPVMAEGVDEASYAPLVGLVGYGPDHGGSRGDGPVEDRVGVFYGQHDAHGAAAERFRAEVRMLGRLVGDPEFSSLPSSWY